MPGPFVMAAIPLLEAGTLGSPIPTRRYSKYPLVGESNTGQHWMGNYDNWPDAAELRRWFRLNGCASAEVALRLYKPIIGIDVDMYGGKRGRESLALLQAKWGRLPDTWMSTSREDGSGIRFYRLPLGVRSDNFRDPGEQMYPGVEVIRWNHRFAMVNPSRHHREGHPLYEWFEPDGYLSEAVPLPEDLSELPTGWCVGLNTGSPYAGPAVRLTGKASEWLKARPNGTGEPCSHMTRLLDRYRAAVIEAAQDGGCYSAMREGIYRMVGNAAEGCGGSFTAVFALWRIYRQHMQQRPDGSRTPTERELLSEFERALRLAIEKVPADKYAGTCALGGA
jgi:hypothetical protein